MVTDAVHVPVRLAVPEPCGLVAPTLSEDKLPAVLILEISDVILGGERATAQPGQKRFDLRVGVGHVAGSSLWSEGPESCRADESASIRRADSSSDS